MRTFLRNPAFSGLLPAIAAVLSFGFLSVASGHAQSTTVVIDQVYGGGGGGSATTTYLYNSDYVELFNLSNASVDISGWSVQYSAAGNSGATSTTVAIPSGTTLAPGQRYLVASSPGTYGGTLPVTPDLVNANLNMSATAGKVYLVNNSTALTAGCPATGGSIVDAIGYGTTAACYEGSTYAPAPSGTTADVRSNSCTDTNQNGTDFVTSGTATPRSSTSTATPCGGTVATPPTVSNVAFTPSTVVAGTSSLLTATVAKGTNTVASVTADTSALGGSSAQALNDSGSGGDAVAGDGVYSATVTVPGSQAANTYSVTVKATDSAASSGTGSGSLTVTAPVVSTPITLTAATATPSTVTGGANVVLSVKANPGTLPTSSGIAVTADLSAFGGSATQMLYDDGSHGDVTPNDNSFAYTLTVPSAQAAASYTITFKGTDAQLRSATTTTTLTVQPPVAAVATVRLSASTSSAQSGTPVSFTAVLSGNKSSTPTGTVTFYDGSTSLGQGTLAAPGTYTVSTSSLSLGGHTITAVYSGDGVYPGVTVPSSAGAQVTITPAPVADFSLSLSNFNLIATDHSKVQTTMVNVAMVNGFSSAVSFTCSGQPAGTRCSFSPATLTQSGSSVLTIGIDGAANHPDRLPNRKALGIEVALLLLPLTMWRRRKMLARSMLAVALLAGVTMGMTGCGADNATPAGSTTLTVQATGGGLTKTATLSLTVQ